MNTNIKTLVNLHADARANGLAIRACNAEIAAGVVAAQLECKAKKDHKGVTDKVYSALRAGFGVPAKATIADLRKLASAARDTDKANGESVKASKAGKALAKRQESALLFIRAYNALAQAISRARKDAGLTAPKAATEAVEADSSDDKDVRAADAADATAESVAAGLAQLPASLLAEAVAMLPASHQSAIAMAIDA